MTEISSYKFSTLRRDELVLHRGCSNHLPSVLMATPANPQPSPELLRRLYHEYALRSELDSDWAARPVEITEYDHQIALILADPGGEPLDGLLGRPFETSQFLRIAISLAAAVGRMHGRNIIHKDIKPSNVLVDAKTCTTWLTGFGIASRLSRERQTPAPPEFIAGTLAYMAPEQTGRMNRSIDARSDLYSLGVTFYQMLTGHLPFTASEPMEWVHCHIARRPVPPMERADVPAAISAIIMKLLTKTVEDRYQTAAGLASDLHRCLAEWGAQHRIDDFPLGERDTPDRLLIPEKLYGREHELATMLAAFDRVVQGGFPELVLVSGYSGVGKSSVVNELHKALVPPRGLFASGKFDQYKRDIPYSTLAQAFQSLIRPLLGRSETDLKPWRDALEEALGPNGRLMTDLVPELKAITGEQPPVPDLPSQDAQRRFQLTFRRFISVFARREHPLALFVDDLQWLDAATLDVIEDLLTQPDLRYLMLIGAYRENEVDATHPLMRKLEAIRKVGASVQEIVLAPLSPEDLKQLIGDSLRCEPERAASLAHLLHEKTAGNPFFVIQFLSSLTEEGLLSFDHREARWSWDLKRIHAKGYTDNVVDLMVGKLCRLPVESQKALQQLACLGNTADLALLTMAHQDSEDELHSNLRAAVAAGLILYSEEAYRFLHDRVQEAAYSLIPQNARAEAHLRIGRSLAARISVEKREEAIFEIVNQLNRGAQLITSAEERTRLAEFNLIAGMRAKTSTAYTSALSYLAAGRALLTERSWDDRYELTFAIEYLMAECELLTARMLAADDRLAMLSQRARSTHHVAMVTRLHLTLYQTMDQSDRAVDVCLDYLRRGGTDWSPHPTSDQVQREYDRIWSQVGTRQIEELIDLPLMTNPDVLDALDVLSEVVTPAKFCDEKLLSLVICRMVNLSLEHGISDGSCFAYVWFAIISGPLFGNYKDGFRFGRLGYEIVEKRGLKRYQARTYMSFGNIVMPWARHARAGRDLIRRALDIANRMGDLTFAAYSRDELISNSLTVGDPLAEVQREAEDALAFVQKARFGLVADIIIGQLAFIRTLRGVTPKFGCFNYKEFDELQFERHLASKPVLMLPEFWYCIRKVQARFLGGDYASALDASLRSQQLLWTCPSQFETAEHHFYGALCRAVSWDAASPEQKQQHLDALTAHHKQLELWAENCPENFENRAALVGAEIARIRGRELDAERLYEDAIRSARINGFIHNEAVAFERAATFYRARGLDQFADLYLRNARYCYLRWGADGKVRQIDDMYPLLREGERADAPTNTIGAAVEHLDLATVIKLSQAVSGEIVLEKMLDTLMRTAIEHAGAERGLLIVTQGAERLLAAEATAGGEAVLVQLRYEPAAADALPESVLHYVLRTRESLILDNASAQPPFSSDPYIRERQARSILCLPLLNQAKLMGVLYFENNLAPRVFTPARIPVLKLLASQAAISLENTRLYRDLAEREAKIRRLVEANIIGIFIFTLEGRILEANEAFLRTVGYDREDLTSGRIRWTDLTPPERLNRDAREWMPELKTARMLAPLEKEYFRKDGSRVPVLIGAAMFEESGNEGVAFVLDLTERQRATETLHEVQSELAHVNRLATVGQLTASIAHEINQPLGAIVINASNSLRSLSGERPDLQKARDAIARIASDGQRAGDVIRGLRALVRKTGPNITKVDIRDAIEEVLVLTRSERQRHGIELRTALPSDDRLVLGDRVQLQQVILNLIMNGIEAMSALMDRPRVLEISAELVDGDGLRVAVEDTGPGLDPATAARVFDPFFTTKPNGMGIGLSICRSIVEAHGGRFWVSPRSPHGATFRFTVPHVLPTSATTKQ